MSDTEMSAREPDDIHRIFVERAGAGDAEALAGLYDPDAVVAYPPGTLTQGRQAIQTMYEAMLARGVRVTREPAMATVRCGDLAVTGTQRADGTGMRFQVVRQQPDGSWLRVIDVPEPAPA